MGGARGGQAPPKVYSGPPKNFPKKKVIFCKYACDRHTGKFPVRPQRCRSQLFRYDSVLDSIGYLDSQIFLLVLQWGTLYWRACLLIIHVWLALAGVWVECLACSPDDILPPVLAPMNHLSSSLILLFESSLWAYLLNQHQLPLPKQRRIWSHNI